jgi:hypothetical protein
VLLAELDRFADRYSELCLLYSAEEARRRIAEEYGFGEKAPPPPPSPQYDILRGDRICQQWTRNPNRADDFAELHRLLNDTDGDPVQIAARIARFCFRQKIDLFLLQEEIQWCEPRAELTKAVLNHFRM